MAEPKEGCVTPAAGPILEESTEMEPEKDAKKETTMQKARVGYPAPDFEANAYHNGGFKTVKLSEYFGKWIVLCFYPGDFTFV